MAKEKKDLPMFALDDWNVTNVRQLEWGTFFTLRVPGLALYDLRVVPAGKNYDAFIAMPQEKAKDGNYYDQYKIYLSAEDTAAILEAVEEALEEEKQKSRRRK